MRFDAVLTYILCFIFWIFYDYLFSQMPIFLFIPFFTALIFTNVRYKTLYAHLGGLLADTIQPELFGLNCIAAPIIVHLCRNFSKPQEYPGALSLYSALFSAFLLPMAWVIALFYGIQMSIPSLVLSIPLTALYAAIFIEAPIHCIPQKEIPI